MHQLGYTRSSRQADHMLLTPDTFVRAPFPGMRNATAIVHATPAIGPRFTEYTVEFGAGGEVPSCKAQRFIYVIEGEISVSGRRLVAESYAYFPEGSQNAVSSAAGGRVVVIEKAYVPSNLASSPKELLGRERELKAQSLGDGLEVRILLPECAEWDFAVNTMTYQPGATLPMVEAHVMEHGLLMLAGSGIYRLGDHWYPVTAGDFIWMAPWCLQWFGALGQAPAKYLIYKDWNR